MFMLHFIPRTHPGDSLPSRIVESMDLFHRNTHDHLSDIGESGDPLIKVVLSQYNTQAVDFLCHRSGVFSAITFPFGIRESSQSTFETTVIGIATQDRVTIVTAGFMVNQPPSPFCNSSRVTAFVSVIAVNIGLVCLPHFAAELFPQLCSADMSGNSSLLPKLASVCCLGLPRFLFTVVLSELFPKPCSAHMSGNSSLLPKSVCYLGLPVSSLRLYVFRDRVLQSRLVT